MTKRVLTSMIGLPLLILVVYLGGLPLRVSLFLLSLIGLRELYTAMNIAKSPVHFVGYVFTAAYYLFLTEFDSSMIFIFNSALIISVLVYLVIAYPKISIMDCAATYFGFFYVSFLMSHIYLIREASMGLYMVWLVFICAFGSDTFALLIGKLFGKHKLVPNLSPKKTVEGAVGGMIGAALLSLIYGLTFSFLATKTSLPEFDIIFRSIVLGAVGSICAQIGDLSASAVKRFSKIKDFGKLFPGHGGVLDRFDSVLFTAPVVFCVMTFVLRR